MVGRLALRERNCYFRQYRSSPSGPAYFIPRCWCLVVVFLREGRRFCVHTVCTFTYVCCGHDDKWRTDLFQVSKCDVKVQAACTCTCTRTCTCTCTANAHAMRLLLLSPQSLPPPLPLPYPPRRFFLCAATYMHVPNQTKQTPGERATSRSPLPARRSARDVGRARVGQHRPRPAEATSGGGGSRRRGFSSSGIIGSSVRQRLRRSADGLGRGRGPVASELWRRHVCGVVVPRAGNDAVDFVLLVVRDG